MAPSIRQPYFGMPGGKPAGVRCVHLDEHLRCALFGDPRRPAACSAFQAEPEFCGADRVQALHILETLERDSLPFNGGIA
nr:hypothetical protein [Haliea sp. SAOS-164]